MVLTSFARPRGTTARGCIWPSGVVGVGSGRLREPLPLARMRMLITGAGGMLGTDLRRAAADAGLDVVACDRLRLDIADRDATGALIRSAAPDVVVNCAAWTDVDGAESSISAALAVNGAGAGNVAAAAASCGAWTIQISSDYVFDGAKREPYVESDPVAPLSMYGRSKLEG